MYKIVDKKIMAEGTVCQLEVEAARVARKAKPGQFIVLRIDEKGERIPLTMAKKDLEKGTITIIFQVVGKTTAHLGTLEPGDALLDVIGPLGLPTHIKKFDGPVICVGGGTGVAVLYPITRGYKEAGNEVIGIIGARTKDLLILEDEMKSSYLDYSMSVIVSRALPDARDGLKPVHRRILYGMYELGVQSNKPH